MKEYLQYHLKVWGGTLRAVQNLWACWGKKCVCRIINKNCYCIFAKLVLIVLMMLHQMRLCESRTHKTLTKHTLVTIAFEKCLISVVTIQTYQCCYECLKLISTPYTHLCFQVIVLSFLHWFLYPRLSHSRADTDQSPAFICSVFFGKTEGSD